MDETVKKWILIVVPVIGLLALAAVIYWILIVRKEGKWIGLLLEEISPIDFLWCIAALLAALAIVILFVKALPKHKVYDPNVRALADEYSLGFLAIYFIPNAFAEELIFRGALQAVIGIVPAAFLFTLMHVSYYKKPLILVEAFLQGLVLGVLMMISGSVWITTIAHAAFNWIQIWCIKSGRIDYSEG